MRPLACLPLLAGCTQLLGLDNLHQNAAAGDAPPPDVIPTVDGADGPPITISGKATFTTTLSSGQQPSPGTKIELLRVSDEALVASTTTDNAGLFSLTVPAGSDILLRATPAQPPFAIVLPVAPPTSDADFSFNVFSDEALEQIASLCPANPNGVDLNLGQILVLVADVTNTPQPGYVINSSHTGQLTCYPTAGGSGSSTSSQGAAIVFDVAPGIDQIQAIDATGPVATSRAWSVPARSQSYLRLEVPEHPTP
jgi:hypothetical protein